MTEAGLARLNYSGIEDDYGRTPQRKMEELVVPRHLRQALMSNRKAWDNFHQLAPSCRRNYIAWISAAKTEGTRDKRVTEAVTLLAQNKKLGLK